MVGSKQRRIPGALLIGATILFFYLPIILMIVFSFNDSRSLTSWNGFSLRWYQELTRNREIVQVVTTTIVVAIISTIVSTIIGTITAIGLSKCSRLLKEIILDVNDLPILNPEIVTAIGMMLLFSSLAVEKGFWTMLLAHIAFSIPYVILSVLPKLRRLDPNIAEAALDLGAKPMTAMTKVIIPQIMPGIISGALIAFTMSFDDFVISYFVTGNGVKNISIFVYTMSKRVNPTINALSTIMVVLITIALVAVNIVPFVTKRKEEGKA
ncbi:MAG: ABC transporter permease [Erysipelotrichaceae bacterium]|jgi:spermidine/putrescine transport system permease protein|nr:ABC transporter permease [Erysipelotrichaceae bacterium]